MVLGVCVTPRAACTRILGVHGECLRVAVQAPAEKGKANQALLRFLADRLGVCRTALKLTAGETARHKRIAVSGLAAAAIRERLAPPERRESS